MTVDGHLLLLQSSIVGTLLYLVFFWYNLLICNTPTLHKFHLNTSGNQIAPHHYKLLQVSLKRYQYNWEHLILLKLIL